MCHHCLSQNITEDDEFFGKVYPTSIRPQAKDIVRTWLYYTLLRCDMLTEKNHGLRPG